MGLFFHRNWDLSHDKDMAAHYGRVELDIDEDNFSIELKIQKKI